MDKKVFSKTQINELEKHYNIVRVPKHSITYHSELKIKAVQDNLNGKAPTMIFIDSLTLK
ncbi:hypothetical protein [Aquibacillus saliphilus]|uniref:hypothetical protein n=1 Tax=Aquibacillus saliphilus TaxID=1909422 RepID=UPI001CF06B33|nr:hypothetical protein [Aquibacillus saliphilus]